MSMDKIELLKRLRDEKMELYKIFKELGHQDTADGYYWEMTGLDTAIQILTDEEYYKMRLSAYE